MGVSAPEIGRAAARHGIELHELTPAVASLESAYLELTRDAVEFGGQHPVEDEREVA